MTKKVLIACSNYYPHNFGGTEVYVNKYCEFLIENGYEAYIITSTPAAFFTNENIIYEDEVLQVCSYLYENIRIFGVNYQKPISTEFIYSKYDQSYEASWEKFIKAQTELTQINTLHIQSFTAITGLNLFNAIIRNNPGIEVITSYHTPISCVKGTLMYGNTFAECSLKTSTTICNDCVLKTQTELPYLIAKGLSYITLNKFKVPALFKTKYLVELNITAFEQLKAITNQWWCYSEGIKKILITNNIHSKKIKMQRHGIDEIFFAPPSVKANDKIIYLFSGRLVKIKGVITLLKAWLNLPEQSHKQLWFTANPTSDIPEISMLLEQANLRKDIFFLGEKSQSELVKLYQQVHFVLIPSEWFEIGPLVFHEAIANNCSVIASNVGGCKELASYYQQNSIVFETGDVEVLANTIDNSDYISTLANSDILTSRQHFQNISTQS